MEDIHIDLVGYCVFIASYLQPSNRARRLPVVCSSISGSIQPKRQTHLWPILLNFLRLLIMTLHNKLEHLSLASLSSLV
jgi:hypothetical protein